MSRKGRGSIENKLGRYEYKQDVREYFRLLEENGFAGMKILFWNLFLDMDCLGRHFDMMHTELDFAWELYGAMPEGTEKEYVCQALKGAKKGISAAKDDFQKLESNVVLGVEVSVIKFRCGCNDRLEKPFPLIKAEQGLERMVEGLADSFREVDKGIEKVAAEGGLCVRKCNGITGWNMWEDGVGNRGLFDILFSMRSLEKFIRQTYDIGERIFDLVDSLRPKAHRHMKKAVFSTGFYWEGGMKEEFFKTESLCASESKPSKSVILKPSLREKMKAVAETGGALSPICANLHEEKVPEMKER